MKAKFLFSILAVALAFVSYSTPEKVPRPECAVEQSACVAPYDCQLATIDYYTVTVEPLSAANVFPGVSTPLTKDVALGSEIWDYGNCNRPRFECNELAGRPPSGKLRPPILKLDKLLATEAGFIGAFNC